ncbi:hypothetical protein GGR51DRAFT_560155 [Nemania sp. FL0031]|nr:hypothetical protein GGR51DRAFT_560155 [Nemania sp. FL0031]
MNTNSGGHTKIRPPELLPAEGLSVVFEGNNPEVDVIFIHGFTGHPYKTWLHRTGDRLRDNDFPSVNELDDSMIWRKAKRLRLGTSSRSDVTVERQIYWPLQLFPATVPASRVLAYGYDSNIRHKWSNRSNLASIYDFAWDLLVSLEALRQSDPLRPTIIIAHSLGGIVAKEMLRRSKGCESHQAHLRHVYESTTGILFFGTPHSGADPRGTVHRVAQSTVAIMGFCTSQKIVDTLFPSSERLRELRDEFGPMVRERGWIVYCFQEQYGLRCLGGRKVVEDASSCLNDPTIEVTQHITANHMDICRFRGIDDPEYQKVVAAIRRVVNRVVKPRQWLPKLRSDFIRPPPLTEERHTELLDCLNFPDANERQSSIKTAHEHTCSWVFKNTTYSSWFDVEKTSLANRFLWIKGKPGSGKSTLMKFLFTDATQRLGSHKVISFFFHARGADLQKTTTGLYRSLLYQLINKDPSLRSILDYTAILCPDQKEMINWADDVLTELLTHAIRDLRGDRVICFIDAIDECNDEQVRDMISFLYRTCRAELSNHFSVCFSSRHYPHISIPAGQQIILETQDDHHRDVAAYIESELRIGSSSRSERIKAEILRKSSGIFMWVVLVINILNREYDKGHVHLLQRRLRELPNTLHDLFRDIVKRDSDDIGDLIICLQWTLFSKTRLTLEELYFAIMSKIPLDAWNLFDLDDISSQDMERFIVNASKGLVESITGRGNSVVQFIHESVRDFLLDERSPSALWPELRGSFFASSHDSLKGCCLAAINSAFQSDGISLKVHTPLEAQISVPFLDYATGNLLFHANAAEAGGISQTKFLREFPLQRWLAVQNIYSQFYPPDSTILYILATKGLGALLTNHIKHTEQIDTRGEQYGLSILSAIMNGDDEILTILSACQAGVAIVEQGAIRGDSGCRILRVAINNCSVSNMEAFLKMWPAGTEFLDTADELGRTPLLHASHGGNLEIVEYLLNRNVNVNHQDMEGWTPLLRALRGGHLPVIKKLLTNDADANIETNDKRSPLHLLFSSPFHKADRKSLFLFLLSHGAVLKFGLTEGDCESLGMGIMSLTQVLEDKHPGQYRVSGLGVITRR